MRRIMLAAAVCAIAAPASAAERRYTVTDFDRVQVEGPFQVALVTGRASSARAIGSNEAFERVSVEVQGRTLRIRSNRSSWGGYPGDKSGTVRIELGTQDLKAASVSGSGSIQIDKAKGMRFDLVLAGSGGISVGRIEADHLALTSLGSGQVKLAGAVKNMKASVKGSGDLHAESLLVEDADISSATAGTVAVAVRRTAKVSSTGSGDTKIVGRPACTVKEGGSGRILCGG